MPVAAAGDDGDLAFVLHPSLRAARAAFRRASYYLCQLKAPPLRTYHLATLDLESTVTKRSLAPAAALVAALAWPAVATAQDAHYWTYGYGPIGQLTEGVLVGGVSDLSAVYYNPGALALIDEPRFVFGLTSIELASIKAADAVGRNLDFDSFLFDIVPAVVAGHLGRNEGQANHFAFAFLSRHDTDWDLGFSNAEVSAASPDAAAGFGRVRERVVEYWVGGTWSHRVREGLSFGVSPFVAYRAQRSRRSLSLEDRAGGTSRSVFVAREHEYNHVRLLAKAGLAWRPGRWELGATVTTAGVSVYDTGKAVFNASVAGESSLPILSASTQRGLGATYHSPWSVAGGATWRGGRTAVHTTVEWFSAVAPYDILAPEPAPVAGTSATVPLTFRGAGRSIVNLGAGLERRLSERLTLYAGAARNASTWRPESETLASWDLVDVTAGVSLDRGGSRLALGLGYAWGVGDLPRAIVPPDETGAAPTTEAKFSRWTISLGASFGGSGR